MALILTFLGKGGTGRTTMAIAAAKRLASQESAYSWQTKTKPRDQGSFAGDPRCSRPKKWLRTSKCVQLKTSVLLERSWEEVKKLEVNTSAHPSSKDVYGQNW
jgi:arsenite-transporting ATPase